MIAGSILFDFTSANNQAARLESVAEDVRKLAGVSIESTCQSLDGAWKGESAAEYQRKLRQLQESIGKTATELQSVAENIRYRSRKLLEAEEAARRIAQTSNGSW